MAEGHKCVQEFGYPDERFETVLSEDLHCVICSCVLKDPVMCQNEHCFCRECITKHLENYHNCPSCNQDLTVESLRNAPRVLRNLLAEQKIRCDYHERGCEELVQLRNLASHVAVCGKAPVVCANEECSSEINEEDQLRHETEECRFREVNCRNCKEMGSMVQEIGMSLGGLCEQVTKLNTSSGEMKISLKAVENRFVELENKFEKMQNRFEKKENQFLNQENSRFMERPRQRMHDVTESSRSDQPSEMGPSNDINYSTEYAYIVAGGYGVNRHLLKSAEVFDKTSTSWRMLQPMLTARVEASSVVYNGKVLVAGGKIDSYCIVSSLEQFCHFWSDFPASLPRLLTGHHSVLYNGKMFIIGGYDLEKKNYSDIIYEMQLSFPFTTKVLAKLPSSIPIQGCGFVLINDKMFMFGGIARDGSKDVTAKVTMYDISKNEFKELAPLPYAVWNMATVKYKENVILAGGSDKCGSHPDIKKTVISYNVQTQKSVMLEPMQQERSQCCAVIDGHTLVVMGGEGKNVALLKSVEAFNMETSKWRSLPSMKVGRTAFIAEIISI